MASEVRQQDRYPIFSAFGDKQEFLTHEEAVAADAQERIRSIWPFMKNRVTAFSKTLKPRERVNFDPEDILAELYVVMIEKDGDWIPERGRYITFAGTIIDRELCSIRDQSRTVESPRNSNCQMKKYRAEEEAGTLTDRCRRTAAQIERTSDISQIAANPGEAGAIGVIIDDPVLSLSRLEDLSRLSKSVSGAVREALNPFESTVLGRFFGLWGGSPQSMWLIAWETGADISAVRKAKIRACSKMRDYLTAVGHPASIKASRIKSSF